MMNPTDNNYDAFVAHLMVSLPELDDQIRDVQFADIRQFVAFQSLAAAGFSAGGGLGMGISPLADCLAKVGER